MKAMIRIFSILCLILSPVFSQEMTVLQQRLLNDGWDLDVIDTARQVEYLSSEEKDCFLLTNAARVDPPLFTRLYIQEYRSYYNGDYLEIPGHIRINTHEGTRAVDELIRAMNNAPPRQVVYPSRGMSQAARDHVNDQGPRGQVGHNSSNGASFSSRIERYGTWNSRIGENISYGYGDAMGIVMQLLVDDGVSSRGHRKNLMSADFNYLGLAIGGHNRYDYMCVMDYAGEYVENPSLGGGDF